jgi:hypothetical protein
MNVSVQVLRQLLSNCGFLSSCAWSFVENKHLETNFVFLAPASLKSFEKSRPNFGEKKILY